jgi:hypothetical protein
MKKQLVTLLGLGLLLATVTASAQTMRLKADVPFDFVVGGRTLPSGEYTIRSLSGGNQILSISAPDQKTIVFLTNMCQSLKASPQSKLIFTRYGDRYVLSEMWIEGSTTGRQLPKSLPEVRVADNKSVETVVVLAELR